MHWSQDEMTKGSSFQEVMDASSLAGSFSLLSLTETSKSLHLDLQDPVWPTSPPRVSRTCRVRFRDRNLKLCHIIPWSNFGDELGPPIVKRILNLHFGCSVEDLPVFDLGQLPFNNWWNRSHSCLMTVGSLWRMVKTDDHLWGTGAAYDGTINARCLKQKPGRVQHVHMYSSRGPLSGKEVQNFCSFERPNASSLFVIEAAGDAGFLVPFLFPELDHPTEKQGMCGIPHRKDEKSSAWKHLPRLLKVALTWQNMTLAMQSCTGVISSSLHGIILAEALGVASRRLRLSKEPGDFKFRDFYSSYRGEEPMVTTQATQVELMEPLSVSERDQYARRILRSFPIHLFERVEVHER